MANEVCSYVGLDIWHAVPRIINALMVGMSVNDIHTLIVKEDQSLSEASFMLAFRAAEILYRDACLEFEKRNG